MVHTDHSQLHQNPQNAPSRTQPHAAETLRSSGHGEPPGWGRAKSPTFAWPPGCETQTSPMVSLTELTDHNLPEEINPAEVGRISPRGLYRAQKKNIKIKVKIIKEPPVSSHNFCPMIMAICWPQGVSE